jgi:hypothetical protein
VVKDFFIHKEETEVDGGFQATMLTEDTDQYCQYCQYCFHAVVVKDFFIHSEAPMNSAM